MDNLDGYSDFAALKQLCFTKVPSFIWDYFNSATESVLNILKMCHADADFAMLGWAWYCALGAMVSSKSGHLLKIRSSFGSKYTPNWDQRLD